MNLIKKMSYSDNAERMNLIVEYLREKGFNYSIQSIPKYDIGNIVVDNSGNFDNDRYILLLAHYDCVQESSGANDNASGVYALMKVMEYFLEIRKHGIKIVFTTMEEQGGLGIQYFLKNTATSRIKLAINIDTCGWGDIIVVCNRSEKIKNAIFDDDGVRCTRFLPFGDDAICEDCYINTITISAMKENDYKCFYDIGELNCDGKDIPDNLIEEYSRLEIFQTMHHGIHDTYDVVNEETILKTAEVVKKLIEYGDDCSCLFVEGAMKNNEKHSNKKLEENYQEIKKR